MGERANPHQGAERHEALKLEGVNTGALATPDPADAGP